MALREGMQTSPEKEPVLRFAESPLQACRRVREALKECWRRLKPAEVSEGGLAGS